MNRFNVIALLFIACGSPRVKDQPAAVALDSAANVAAGAVTSGCYTWVVIKDTALMRLTVTANIVTGDLVYNCFEKDRNKGTITGVIKDSLVLADYTFLSEGTRSVRQVAFKINGDSLAEAFGEVTSTKDMVMFSDLSKLQFQTGRALGGMRTIKGRRGCNICESNPTGITTLHRFA